MNMQKSSEVVKISKLTISKIYSVLVNTDIGTFIVSNPTAANIRRDVDVDSILNEKDSITVECRGPGMKTKFYLKKSGVNLCDSCGNNPINKI